MYILQKAPSLDLERVKNVSQFVLENGTVSEEDDREITIPYIGKNQNNFENRAYTIYQNFLIF